MAKLAATGRVKTRLMTEFTPQQATEIHRTMLGCVMRRVERVMPDWPRVIALDCGPPYDHATLPEPLLQQRTAWRVRLQGDGDLGERMARVASQVGGGPLIFLGADCPDAPLSILWQAVVSTARPWDVMLGPTTDGGYWTLTLNQCQPILLQGIDWGTDRVYHQTLAKAHAANLRLVELDLWHDVDTPDDLAALHRRLRSAREKELTGLALRLRSICQEHQP